VSADDIVLGQWTFAPDAPAPDTRLLIPRDAWKQDGGLRLDFNIDAPLSPAKLGLSADARELGLLLCRISLATADSVSPFSPPSKGCTQW
jgi:hypothetical protein